MKVHSTAPGLGLRAGLDPIKIPVVDDGGHGGIGHDDLNDPQDGVVLSVRMGPNFFVGDWIELFWEGVQVQAFPITDDHYQAGIIGFSVLPVYIIKPGVESYTAKVYYVVSDVTGSSATLVPPREVLVKNTVPGNPDPIPDTPYLNERLTAPAGLPPQINPPVVPVTLTVEPWQYMHEDDQLTVYWGGTHNKVTQPIVGVDQQQTVTLPTGVIEAGGDSPNLRVLYSVRDLVGNWSLYSEAALTNVAIDPSKPGQPRVLDDGRPTVRIDLDTLGTHTITVEIPAYVDAVKVKAHGPDTLIGRIAIGDQITLTWAGETAEGIALIYTPPSLPVTDPGFGPVFTIPGDYVTRIANGMASVSYEVDPADGTAHRFSRSSTITVVRQQAEELAAPELLDAKGGTRVDLADVPTTGASVNIAAYTGKQSDDIIYLLWEGKNAQGAPVVHEDNHRVSSSEETQPYVFIVDKSQVERIVGGSLKLSYRVQFTGGIDLPSVASTYTVVGQVLAKPQIRSVTGATADVPNGGSTRDTELAISGKASPNETISIHDENGSRGEFLVNPAGNWTTSVLMFAVSTMQHVVTAKVVGVDPISDPWRFTVTQGPVIPRIRSVIGPNGSVSNDGSTIDTELTITGSGTPNATISIHDEAGFRGEYPIDSTGTWTTAMLAFAVSASQHLITAKEVGVEPISAPWRFTVTQSTFNPQIRSVVGASGAVSDGGSTGDTELIIRGRGTPNAIISIHDEAGFRGEYPIDATGNWATTVLAFAVSASQHFVTAKEVGVDPISAPWRFTVKQSSVNPQIRSVVGANGAVSDGGSTRDTLLTISGLGTPNATISIHDEAGFRGEYLMGPTGHWTTAALTFEVSITQHRVTAKEVGVPPISAPWGFTVVR